MTVKANLHIHKIHTEGADRMCCLSQKSQAAPVNIHITTPQQAPQQPPYQGYAPPMQASPSPCTYTWLRDKHTLPTACCSCDHLRICQQ